MEWRSETGLTELEPDYVDEHRRQVIEVNRAEVHPFIQALRCQLSVPVIDPTALDDLPGWTQPDYRHLWGRVIERYVDTAVFVYGWEYSSGCCYEFLVAKKAGVNTVDGEMNNISTTEGHALLTAAIGDYRRASISTDLIEEIKQQLFNLSDGKVQH